MSARHLVLVGMMGAGKTSVGRVCARRLHREFIDTDELVEARHDMTVAEIFESEGEAGFRWLERDVVANIPAWEEPFVIACGGGVVLDPENRHDLERAGCVVWLQADPAVLGDRVGGGGSRPLLAAGGAAPAATLERIAAERDPLYAEVADARVDTTGLTVDQVADAVLEAYAS